MRKQLQQIRNSWQLPPWEFPSLRGSSTNHRAAWTLLMVAMAAAMYSLLFVTPLHDGATYWLAVIGLGIGVCAGITGMYNVNGVANFSVEMPIALAFILAGHPLAAIACAVGSPIGQQLRKRLTLHLWAFNMAQVAFAALVANLVFNEISRGTDLGEIRWAVAALISAVAIIGGQFPVIFLDKLSGELSLRKGISLLFEEVRFMIPVGLITSMLCASLFNTPIGIVAMLFPLVFQHSLYTNVNRALHAVQESLSDPLTTLGNRRMFDMNIEYFFAENDRRNAFGLFVDLDHFKRLNDTLGHDAGDEALVRTAAIIKSNMRNTDLACRIGGEEFVVMFFADSREDARDVGERLRHEIELNLVDFNVTASIGVAQVSPNESSADLTRRGDEAMYRAKRNGRNRVVVEWEEDGDEIRLQVAA